MDRAFTSAMAVASQMLLSQSRPGHSALEVFFVFYSQIELFDDICRICMLPLMLVGLLTIFQLVQLGPILIVR